jgi:hypothetical protein
MESAALHAVTLTFVSATFMVPLITGVVDSTTRYILMLITCFMVLGVWGKQVRVDRQILAIFLPLMAYVAILASHWWFAA